MFNLLRAIFTAGNFEPHNVHFLGYRALLWIQVSGNALIALSYILIPLALLYLVRKRRDIMFTPIFWLFAAFIVLCGLTHIMHIMTYWYPAYWLQAIVLWLTGIVSIFTFFALVWVIPTALQLKSPKQLEEINTRLSAEIENRKQAEDELRQKNQELEKMNKVMVGRELKMVELKKELETLREKTPRSTG